MNKSKVVKLGDVVTVVNDNEYDPIKNGITKYVAGRHIKSEKMYVEKFGDVNRDQEIIGSAFHKLFKKNHILYKTRFPNSGAIATFDGLCSNTTLVLKTKKDSGLIEGLLPFILHWDRFEEYLIKKSVGSTNSYVRWRDLADFTFILPLEKEQLKIHDIFWSIQNSIDALENLIQKTKNHFTSKSEFILSQGIDHKKFKKFKILFDKTIKIPENWGVSELNDCINSKTMITYGIVQAGPHIPSGVPYIRACDMNGGEISSKELLRTSPEIASKYTRSQVNSGDLVFGIRGTVGSVSLVPDELNGANLTQDTAKISPSEDFDRDFLMWVLRSSNVQSQVNSKIIGSAVKGINLNDLKKVKIIHPKEIKEQKQIALILTKLNQHKFDQQNHLKNLYLLRKSILNLKLISKEVCK